MCKLERKLRKLRKLERNVNLKKNQNFIKAKRFYGFFYKFNPKRPLKLIYI